MFNSEAKTAEDLWPTSRLKGSMGGKVLRGDINGREFLLNWANGILAKDRPRA